MVNLVTKYKYYMLFIIVLVISLLVIGIYFLLYKDENKIGGLDIFPKIDTVQIVGPIKYVSQEEVKRLVLAADIKEKNFFSVNMKRIKKKLSSNPWIYDINIQRLWPDKLRISFKEDEPVAYLNFNSIITQRDCKPVIINDSLSGNLIVSTDKDLPILVGNEKKSKKLCDTLEKLEKSVKPINSRIKKMVVSQRNSIYIELDNGLTVLLGNRNISERFDRFVRYINYISDQSKKIRKDVNQNNAYIDMRYHNGLAVGIKTDKNLTEIMETA